jgi:hypothetical protein
MNEFLKTEWWDNFDRDLYYRIRKIKSIVEDEENANKVKPVNNK